MVRSLKWTLFTLWTALPALVRGGNATTDVVCQSTFSWMNNGNNQSPCLVAAVLSGVCATAGGWNVPALGPNDAYSTPNSSTANACVCSWAVYNLLGACTVCQGSPDVDNWAPYNAGCGSFAIDTYWPTNYTVPNNTLLPYWASTDPLKWPGGSFNSDNASAIHSQGIALLLPSVEHGSICTFLSRKK
ncbi:hypothetical protein M378DRAFT_816355 [Amanita muscaria Koide BX008]|uniref:Uncharacterized protein n=1 Tax=Amanita muscaria (strain Koide BX008) TaxID=946122 RepID=A0A0C2SFD7_AMAMK|nr:hypothetical protein M378DRAFT_816355 [Amanita muscaria Koide BX008]